jgi:hypothetical protein
VDWLIAGHESAELAEQLIADTVAWHDVEPGMLTLHAGRPKPHRLLNPPRDLARAALRKQQDRILKMILEA